VKWLTPGGVAAAVLVGSAVSVGQGMRGLALLIAFFTTSSLMTSRTARDLGEAHGRTARQVLANGAVAAVTAVLGWGAATAGAIAAATADTWATEMGRRANAPPRLITTWRQVAPGTSGGVTALGTMTGIAGATFVGVLDAWLTAGSVAIAVVVAVAGVAGMLADSLLGASVQARFGCPTCGRLWESPHARCHAPLQAARGVRWLDNDAVNLAATLVGAGSVALLARWWG